MTSALPFRRQQTLRKSLHSTIPPYAQEIAELEGGNEYKEFKTESYLHGRDLRTLSNFLVDNAYSEAHWDTAASGLPARE